MLPLRNSKAALSLDPIENRKEHTSYWFETGGARDRGAADECQPVYQLTRT